MGKRGIMTWVPGQVSSDVDFVSYEVLFKTSKYPSSCGICSADAPTPDNQIYQGKRL
jgi:hypothetical protein